MKTTSLGRIDLPYFRKSKNNDQSDQLENKKKNVVIEYLPNQKEERLIGNRSQMA